MACKLTRRPPLSMFGMLWIDVYDSMFQFPPISSKFAQRLKMSSTTFQSTVNAVIVKWKRLGATVAQPRKGRPHKLTERDRRVLKRVARKSRLSSVATLITEFESGSGSNVSKITVCQEPHEMGFYGRAAAHKPKITMHSAKCWLE